MRRKFFQGVINYGMASLDRNVCHSPSGIMDFNALDYKEEQIKKLPQNLR